MTLYYHECEQNSYQHCFKMEILNLEASFLTKILTFNYRPPTKLGEGTIFTEASHFLHRGSAFPQCDGAGRPPSPKKQSPSPNTVNKHGKIPFLQSKWIDTTVMIIPNLVKQTL